VKLTDFGLAKCKVANASTAMSATTGVLKGTHRYLAPELIREDTPPKWTMAADVYAMAVMSWDGRCCTARSPGKTSNPTRSSDLRERRRA
jgi:serine/threonine protein kinase